MRSSLAVLGFALLSVDTLVSSSSVHTDVREPPRGPLSHDAEREGYLSPANGRRSSNSTHNTVWQDSQMIRRKGGGRFTFYETGLGACGAYNKDSDFIVALNIAQWDGGSHCFEKIWVSRDGKTTEAQITDLCPGCPYGGLDLSPGLFAFFASLDEGVIQGDWGFGGRPAAEAPKPPPKLIPMLTADVANVLHRSSTTHASRTLTRTHRASHTSTTLTPTSTIAASSTASPSSSNSSALSDPKTLSSSSAEVLPVLVPTLISGFPSLPLQTGVGAPQMETLQVLNKALIALGSLVTKLQQAQSS